MENILHIHHVTTTTPLPYIKREIEEKMVCLLKQIERVFELTRSRVQFARNNCPNYYYVLFTLLDSLHQHGLLHRIPRLNPHVGLKQLDALWRGICEELEWPFRPTKHNKQNL